MDEVVGHFIERVNALNQQAQTLFEAEIKIDKVRKQIGDLEQFRFKMVRYQQTLRTLPPEKAVASAERFVDIIQTVDSKLEVLRTSLTTLESVVLYYIDDPETYSVE